jgi:hypothetical protein
MARLTAEGADKHTLYQQSVQDPPSDIRFIDRVFRKARGRSPSMLREDFCGTALLCSTWVQGKRDGVAYGIDLDGPTLAWAMRHNVLPLGDAAARVHLLQQDVLDPVAFRADVAAAFNFSWWGFKSRVKLVDYARAVAQSLVPDGAFFLDIYGGLDCTETVTEETKHAGFTYLWEQAPYDPINGFGVRHIHFHFRDGTKCHRAFSYDWRIWTLPELRDVLYDAGFAKVDVYWEGATEDGDGDGVFRRRVRAEQEEAWIAYVVAWRS